MKRGGPFDAGGPRASGNRKAEGIARFAQSCEAPSAATIEAGSTCNVFEVPTGGCSPRATSCPQHSSSLSNLGGTSCSAVAQQHRALSAPSMPHR